MKTHITHFGKKDLNLPHFFLVFTFIKFPICSFFVGFGNGSGIDDGGGVWADGQLCKLQFPKT